MKFRSNIARWLGVIGFLGMGASAAAAQVATVQRIAGMVAIAADEYGKAIDGQGRLVSIEEYQEAVGFLAEAKASAGRLPSERRGAAAILDSIITAVDAKRPVGEVKAIAA